MNFKSISVSFAVTTARILLFSSLLLVESHPGGSGATNGLDPKFFGNMGPSYLIGNPPEKVKVIFFSRAKLAAQSLRNAQLQFIHFVSIFSSGKNSQNHPSQMRYGKIMEIASNLMTGPKLRKRMDGFAEIIWIAPGSTKI